MAFKRNQVSGVTAEIRIKRCYGCGAILQDKDPDEKGYIPTDKLEGDENLCERCFKLRHYSKFKATGDIQIDYLTMLSNCQKDKGLIVFVMSSFLMNSSLLSGLDSTLMDNFIAVINKRDLLSKNVSDQYLKDYALNILKKKDLTPKEIIVTSTSSRTGIDELLNSIEKYRNGRDVYFIGTNHVGKSSLVNCLLTKYVNKTDKMITTSPYPGTTVDVISIPLDEKTFIYDTPGIRSSSSIISAVEPEAARYILPRNMVKDESYLLKEGQSVLFSNFARFDFIKGSATSFSFVKSADITLSRCKSNKAEKLFDEICSNKMVAVRSDLITSSKQLKKVSITAAKDQRCNLVISGLGLIRFKGNDQQIDMYVPLNVDVTLEKDYIE